MKFTQEQLTKAKAAKSAEELFAYAKEVGYPLTEEETKTFFEQWHKEVELADEELDNVAGGSLCVDGYTYSDDPPHRLIVTALYDCPHFSVEDGFKWGSLTCCNCRWSEYKKGVLYCIVRSLDNDPYR